MTFHSVDNNGRTAFADFADFSKPDEIPFFIPTDEVVTPDDMDIALLSATVESIGVVEASIESEIDALEDITSVFDLLDIPTGSDVERYW